MQTRREFLKFTALGGLALSLPSIIPIDSISSITDGKKDPETLEELLDRIDMEYKVIKDAGKYLGTDSPASRWLSGDRWFSSGQSYDFEASFNYKNTFGFADDENGTFKKQSPIIVGKLYQTIIEKFPKGSYFIWRRKPSIMLSYWLHHNYVVRNNRNNKFITATFYARFSCG